MALFNSRVCLLLTLGRKRMKIKTSLTLGLAIVAASAMSLRADEAAAAKPAEAAKPAAAAPAAKPAEAKPAADASATDKPATEAKAAATPVAKNDAPGSITPGNQLNADGKFEEAIAYFEGIGEQSAANGHSKREPWRLVGLSSAQIGAGKFADAAASAQKAIDIDPKNGVAWNNLGSALAQSGKREEAIAAYDKGIATLKAAGADTAKLEGNVAPIKAALEEAKAKADKKAGKVAAKAADAAAGVTKAAAAAAAPVEKAAEAAKPAAAEEKK